MNAKTRRMLLFGTRAARSPLQAPPAHAQTEYPNKVIRMIVGFAAGGGNDIFARLVATKLSERTGWTVIIENKPGAGGRLAADYAAKEAPDGYTVLVGASGAMAIGPIIYKTGYDTLKSFEPVTMIADFPLILVVHPDHPAKTVKELVEWTKANPDKANYSSSSPAFTLPTELFKLRTGAKGVAIPYKSSGEMLLGVVSGNAAMAIIDPPPTTAQVQAGKLRALAVTGAKRTRELPDVPTMAEAGVPGCRGRIVERLLRSGRHAEADHRQAREGIARGDPQHAGARSADRHGGQSGRQHAGRIPSA